MSECVSTSLAGTARRAIGAHPCLLIPSGPSPSRQHSCTFTHHPRLHLYPPPTPTLLAITLCQLPRRFRPPTGGTFSQHLKAMPLILVRGHLRPRRCYNTVTLWHRVDKVVKRTWPELRHTTTWLYSTHHIPPITMLTICLNTLM